MAFWKGFFEALRAYSEWKANRNAQKKRFKVLLADAEALAIEQQVVELRASLKTHVEKYHKGEKPAKVSRKDANRQPQGPYPLTDEEMSAYLGAWQ
jgi:hypothetical protein